MSQTGTNNNNKKNSSYVVEAEELSMVSGDIVEGLLNK